MTLEEIRHELTDRKAMAVARATGLHFQTVRRVRDGQTANPSAETIRALTAYIKARRYTP